MPKEQKWKTWLIYCRQCSISNVRRRCASSPPAAGSAKISLYNTIKLRQDWGTTKFSWHGQCSFYFRIFMGVFASLCRKPTETSGPKNTGQVLDERPRGGIESECRHPRQQNGRSDVIEDPMG